MPEYRIAGVGLRDVDLHGLFDFFTLIHRSHFYIHSISCCYPCLVFPDW